MPYPLGHWVTTGSGFSHRLLTRCHHRAPPLRSAASRRAVSTLEATPPTATARACAFIHPWPRQQANPGARARGSPVRLPGTAWPAALCLPAGFLEGSLLSLHIRRFWGTSNKIPMTVLPPLYFFSPGRARASAFYEAPMDLLLPLALRTTSRA